MALGIASAVLEEEIDQKKACRVDSFFYRKFG